MGSDSPLPFLGFGDADPAPPVSDIPRGGLIIGKSEFAAG